ncbi:predicted protein [Uncinocarpus reesii 1704]|uniref:VOC domain-containing protein n=1 Tax=Uncinocarpus reesii (strain UAMH 1704) TaxID=336963 RepID=C4JZM6_UNCRE|nr:uncharacterized protein UREG_07627 [Uncinocarpus reesii 1704]EEP82762.1 predicted protein [Uncinocarpus reesii 1704]
MARPVFINMPTSDLPAATAFYEAIGFIKHPFFSSPTSHGMVNALNHDIVVMLSTADQFQKFLPAERASLEPATHRAAKNATIHGLSAKSRQEVDEAVETAVRAGAKAFPPLKLEGCDDSMMYSRSFADLDGYLWEIVWCDEGMVKMAQEAFAQKLKQLEEEKGRSG